MNTLDEFKTALQNRETQKAAAKARQEEKQNNTSAGFPTIDNENKSGSPTAAADFKF